ncbi:hypothetical protein BU15DRAFT_62785 [Melanogaster broomeanus]|nr:hypothetical protein BU15DRAFT_62785 [Melanogaster broomeanus]
MAKLSIMLTIPDLLLMHVTYLETAYEWFQHLTDLFKMKKSSVTQREAMCNPRTAIRTHKKQSEGTHKPRKCGATMNKPESATAAEPHNSTCRKLKCKAGEQGKVEKRDRRGKRTAGWTGEQEAAVREPGEEAVDEATCSISLAVMPSSQDDNGRDIEVPCMTVNPPKPETTHPVASKAAADTANPNMMSIGPPESVGTLREPQDELQEPTDEEEPPSMPLEGGRDASGQMMSRHADEGASSDPAKPACTNTGTTTEVQDDANTTAAAHSHSTSSATAESSNSMHIAQRHSMIAPGEEDHVQAKWPHNAAAAQTMSSPRVPDGIVKDPGGHVRPHMPGKPPSILFEGECNAEMHTSGACAGQQHSANVHGEGCCTWAWHVGCATSSTSRNPKWMKMGPPAEVRAHQDRQYVHRP